MILLEVTGKRNIKWLGLGRLWEFHSFIQKTELELLEKKLLIAPLDGTGTLHENC